ncbi:hypothetical protein F5Y08DRAFT_26644 [Xylaria arbuscula]|nr:hypothetical protein F5Y08DRAFT_26644 [Xylaria arbuscula]
MLAMKRLPNDSFLPSGGIDAFDRSMSHIHHFNVHPTSTISPLSLEQSLNQPYFDTPRSNHASPSSPSGARAPRQYLSPQHNSLLTPTRGRSPGPCVASPSLEPVLSGTISPFEHLSPQAAATLLQRREDHNRRLRENWEAERTHLEASRARAEEMFREERNMMDDERLIWVKEKAELETELERQKAVLEKRNNELENELLKWKQRAEDAETKLAELIKSKPTYSSQVMPGLKLDGAVNDPVGSQARVHSAGSKLGGTSSSTFRTPSDGVSPGSLPPGKFTTIPESNPFVPLDPRMQSASPTSPPTTKGKEREPSIPINEVIPGSDGVDLKASAVQRATFDDGKSLSPTLVSCKTSSPDAEKSMPELQSYVSPAVRTQETLKAPEHHRLTMHAGHTPNHSMSFSNLPTMESTAGNTAGSSGTSTPTAVPEPIITIAADVLGQSNEETTFDSQSGDVVDTEEAIYEPSDEDPALKGPLCLRNRPGADEAFLRRLSDKLEEVKATDAAPSVLNDLTIKAPLSEGLMDNKTRHGIDSEINDDQTEDAIENVEEDAPLRFKPSSNFGQPLGQVRRTSDL